MSSRHELPPAGRPAGAPLPDDAIDWRERFSEAYDGELSAPEQEAFEAWLAVDEGARAEYEAFCRSLELLHGLDFNRAPRDFVRGVTQDIQRESRGAFFNDTWWLGFRVPYEAFAAVVLAIFAALYLFGSAGAPRSYAVSDAPEPAAAPPEAPSERGAALLLGGGAGLAAGAETQVLVVTLPARTDLGLTSRQLRGDGFATRPDLIEGREAVRVSVAASQLERFAERLFVATGADLKATLQAQLRPGQHAVTVRLVSAPSP